MRTPSTSSCRTVLMNLHDVTCSLTVVVYLEFLVLNVLSVASMHNHLAVLQHYFALYDWPTQVLSSRTATIFYRSVKMKSKMFLKMKGIFTISMLQQLIHYAMQEENGPTNTAIFPFVCFTFTRLYIFSTKFFKKF